MEPKANYTIVGLMVLILSAALISSLLWLSVGFERKKYNKYVVYTHESVAGLSDDSPVKFNGVPVGAVKNIHLDPQEPQQIKITINVEEGTLITESTMATLVTQGITGTTYLGLNATTPTLEPLKKAADEEYPVIPYKASFFNRLEKNIDDVTNGFKNIFDTENAKMLRESLSSLAQITKTIADNNNNINKSLNDLPIVMSELKNGLRELNKTVKDIASASNSVTAAMKSGKKGIDKITNQTLPPTTILLQRLDLIAANLESITKDMRVNPSIIIRGKSPSKPGPGE